MDRLQYLFFPTVEYGMYIHVQDFTCAKYFLLLAYHSKEKKKTAVAYGFCLFIVVEMANFVTKDYNIVETKFFSFMCGTFFSFYIKILLFLFESLRQMEKLLFLAMDAILFQIL